MDETIPSRQNKVRRFQHLSTVKLSIFSTAMFVYKLLWRHSNVIVIWIPIGRCLPFPLRQKKFVENVIDLSQHVEIDLSRFRQVSNIFFVADFLLLSETCFRLVGNLSKTCWRLCRKRVLTCFRQDRSNGIWPLADKTSTEPGLDVARRRRRQSTRSVIVISQ